MTATTADIHDINSRSKAKKAKEPREMTRWGATWRVAVIFLVFTAATIAVVLGMHYGVAYIVGLGLAEALSLTLQAILGVVAYIVSTGFALAIGVELVSIFEDRARTAYREQAAK